MDVVSFYDAAARAGLLSLARISGTGAGASSREVVVEFRQPDEDVLGGLAVSRDYQIRFPASSLTLVAGDTLSVGGHDYRVREVSTLGDGQECRATLMRI